MTEQPLVDIPIQPATTAKPTAATPPASTPATPTQPTPTTPKLPSSDQMLADLNKSGNTVTPPQPTATSTNQNNPKPAASMETELEDLKDKARPIFRYIRLMVAIALTIQGLYGLYKSINFILIEYPKLEMMLINNQITQEQVTALATKALITLGTTILGLIFAMRIMRSKAAKVLNTVIGICLFLFGAYLNSYVTEHFDVIDIITTPFLTFFRFVGLAGETVTESTKQLPIDTTDTPTIIWEQ